MPGPTSTIIRAVVRDATRHRWATTITGVTFALLGVVTLLIELLRYWLTDHAIHAAPVCIGCLFGFVGFFAISPTRAKEGAGIVVDSTVRVIGVVRGGRRSTDTPVVVARKNTEDKP
jgi:protein-S-isoprenylcysteine O-methyltransferase Ste14